MLDFDKWFFVLVANFLVLLFLLNKILFQPFLEVLKKREASTKGSIEAANEMHAKREKLLEETKRDLSHGAQRAREEFEKMRGEGLGRQRDMLAASNAQAASLLEKARGELKSAADKARGELRADVEKFSDEIVRKLAGV
jgi:F-type H+-transporting ATPase subunit b